LENWTKLSNVTVDVGYDEDEKNVNIKTKSDVFDSKMFMGTLINTSDRIINEEYDRLVKIMKYISKLKMSQISISLVAVPSFLTVEKGEIKSISNKRLGSKTVYELVSASQSITLPSIFDDIRLHSMLKFVLRENKKLTLDLRELDNVQSDTCTDFIDLAYTGKFQILFNMNVSKQIYNRQLILTKQGLEYDILMAREPYRSSVMSTCDNLNKFIIMYMFVASNGTGTLDGDVLDRYMELNQLASNLRREILSLRSPDKQTRDQAIKLCKGYLNDLEGYSSV
jgi:hypothetical protein